MPCQTCKHSCSSMHIYLDRLHVSIMPSPWVYTRSSGPNTLATRFINLPSTIHILTLRDNRVTHGSVQA